jgi:hypothetical protein
MDGLLVLSFIKTRLPLSPNQDMAVMLATPALRLFLEPILQQMCALHFKVFV